MTARRNWMEIVHHYKTMLIYIAVVVTIGTILQIIQATKGLQ